MYATWKQNLWLYSIVSYNQRLLCHHNDCCGFEWNTDWLWILIWKKTNHFSVFQTFPYFHVGNFSSLKLTVLSTIHHLQAKTKCKSICQCCLAGCEREQKDLDTGCIRQKVLCQLFWLCQVINLSRTVWHATPHIKQEIYCSGFGIM